VPGVGALLHPVPPRLPFSVGDPVHERLELMLGAGVDGAWAEPIWERAEAGLRHQLLQGAVVNLRGPFWWYLQWHLKQPWVHVEGLIIDFSGSWWHLQLPAGRDVAEGLSLRG
jgi:hypothetical protein